MKEWRTMLASGSTTSIRSCLGLINGSSTCLATIGLDHFVETKAVENRR
jgi:hypothetical protein